MAVTIKGSGQVPVQVIQTVKNDSFTTTSGTMVDVTGLSATITPTSSSNKVLVLVSFVMGGDTWDTSGVLANLVRNSTALGLGTGGSVVNATTGFNAFSSSQGNTLGNFAPVTITFLDSPNTTSATTYKIQVRNRSAGYTTVVGKRTDADVFAMSSSITVMEISG
jgi:hypothetical protein